MCRNWEISSAQRCEWEGIHAQCVFVWERERERALKHPTKRASLQKEKWGRRSLEGLDSSPPRTLQLRAIGCLLWMSKQFSFAPVSPVTHAALSPTCVLYDPRSCVVTEHLHSKLSDSCGAWRLCIISSARACVYVCMCFFRDSWLKGVASQCVWTNASDATLFIWKGLLKKYVTAHSWLIGDRSGGG